MRRLVSVTRFALLTALILVGLPMVVRAQDTAPTSGRIEMRIDSPAGALGPNWPMYCGVPLPKGSLTSTRNVRVVDAAGKPVPAQVRRMASWVGTKSIRWLGVDFVGDPSGEYYVEFGPALRPASAVEGKSPVISVSRVTAGFRVNTGPAQFTVRSSGPFLADAFLDRNGDGTFSPDEQMIANTTADGLYAVDNQGRRGAVGRDQEPGQLKMEPDAASSPAETPLLHASARREGWYVTSDGTRIARHITRLHFYAGKPFVRIVHTFVFTEDTNKLWFKEIGIRFRHRLRDAGTVVFDDSHEFDEHVFRAELDEAHPSLYMFQEKAIQFSRRDPKEDCRFVIGRVCANGATEDLETGQRCGEWVDVSGPQGGVTLAMRDFWQQFPKELEVTRNAITAHLWSRRGGRELDVRLQTLRKKWPEEWLSPEDRHYDVLKKNPSNTLGVAKTHELLLHLRAPDAGVKQVARLAHALNRPVYCLADPAWLYRSEAMGPIYPRDTKRFPLAEGFMETYFDQYMKIIRSWGDNGFFDFGSGPHIWYRIAKKGPLKGTWIAYLARYSGQIDYGFHTHLWRMYARSGQRKYLEYAEETNRHRMDVCMVHWDSPKAYKPIVGAYMHGKYKGGFSADNSQVYWGLYTTLHHQSGTDLRKLYWYYYLRDYRRAHDVSEEYHALVKKVWQHSKGPFSGTRPFPTLKCLGTLYQETGDPEILAIGRERLKALVDLESPQGVIATLPTKMGKYGPKMAGIERWYEATGDDLAAKAILRGAETCARTSMGNLPYSYYNCFPRVLDRAYRMTGDPLYARTLRRNMDLAVAKYHDPRKGVWADVIGYTCSASNNVYPMGDMAIGMDAIARNGKALDPTPAVQQTGRGRPVLALFRKPKGKEIVLDVRGRCPIRPRVYTLKGDRVAATRLDPFRETISSLEKIQRPSFFQVRVPSEQPAGTYILDAGIGSAPWEVTWTNAPQIVLFAPGGLSAGCGATWKGRFYPGATPEAAPVTWRFHVPGGARRFRVFRSGHIVLRDPQGREIRLAAEVPGWSDVAVGPQQEDRLWSFRAPRTAFVELRGVPPVLAADRAERFFLPDLEAIRVEQFGLERDYAFADRSILPKDEVFVATGKDRGKGLALTGGRAIAIERGKPLGEGRFENFNCHEGTIELWLKPDWSSVYQPRSRAAERMVLWANPWVITLHYLGHLSSLFGVSGSTGRLTDIVGLSPERGRWTHLAYQWYHAGKDFVLETYVNGRLRNLDHARAPKSGHYVGRKAGWQPRDIGKTLVFGRSSATRNSLDGVVDELCISDVRRYQDDFVPSLKTPHRSDGHTLALFHFNGNLDGVRGVDATPVQARLLTR